MSALPENRRMFYAARVQFRDTEAKTAKGRMREQKGTEGTRNAGVDDGSGGFEQKNGGNEEIPVEASLCEAREGARMGESLGEQLDIHGCQGVGMQAEGVEDFCRDGVELVLVDSEAAEKGPER